MVEYACRECGATDSFESSENTRTVHFILRIEDDDDGQPAVVETSEYDTTTLDDPNRDLVYECSACGNSARDLDDLVRVAPDPDDDLSNPEIHHDIRLLVTMLGVGWAHDDDAIVIQALNDLGTMLGICREYAEGVEHGMVEHGLLHGAAEPGVCH